VKPENWHLTLQFLGDVPLSDVGSLADSMEAMLEPLSPFEIELAGLGAFPRVSKARVLWVGVDRGIENLKCLAQRVREGCITAGHPGDKRPFEGHLTLARAKAEPVSISVPPAIFKARWGNHQVDSISLVRSRLESGGPVYEILKEIPLGSSF
jgi:2'-5' RNA ligase